MLSKALYLAVDTYAERTYGEMPYIFHATAVSTYVNDISHEEHLMIAALLYNAANSDIKNSDQDKETIGLCNQIELLNYLKYMSETQQNRLIQRTWAVISYLDT